MFSFEKREKDLNLIQYPCELLLLIISFSNMDKSSNTIHFILLLKNIIFHCVQIKKKKNFLASFSFLTNYSFQFQFIQIFLSFSIQQTFWLTLYNQTFLFFYSQKSSTQTIFILNWRRQILFFPTQIFDSITNCTSIIGILCFFLIILSPTINFSYFFN
jgi:hypothetical protein